MTSRALFLTLLATCLMVPCLSRSAPVYSIPLHFDPVGDGVEVLPVELEYDLTDPTELRIANLRMGLKNFYAMIVDAKKLDKNLTPLLGANESKLKYFVFSWPEYLLPEGKFEMIGKSGQVLWQFDINEKMKATWLDKLANYRYRLIKAKVPSATINTSPIFGVPFAVEVDLNREDNPISEQEMPYRFCISKYTDTGYSRVCSAYYETIKNGKQVRMEISPKALLPARVFVYNENAELKASIPVPEDRTVQFFAELGIGMSYEFVATPEKIHLLEMMAGSTSQEALVRAWGPRPMQSSRILNPDDNSYLTELIGWQSTIGDLRKFWEARMDRDVATIYIPGNGGGCFKQKFIITKLPTEDLRPYIERHSVNGSYSDNVKIFGRKKSKLKISTTQNSVDLEDKQDFTWYFSAAKRGELNRSYLLVRDGQEEFRTYHEIFKGLPRELSVRSSAILSTNRQAVLMGEASFQYWLEDLMGWSDYYVSRQRWGISAKYFQSLMPFALGSVTDTLRTTTIDLKYRLVPGLWNRDETWGAILGYQRIQYFTFDSGMIGTGLFWARSMPKVFDELLNEFRFLKYPKWVDMEFIYYTSPTDSKTRIKFPNFALNFHGKIIWSKYIFGEAGFGVKQYNFDNKTTRLNMTFGSLYGTAGLGISF